MIPFLDLTRQHREIEREITAAFTETLQRGVYILGREVELFETEWARFCGSSATATVGNGTDALTLALIASGAVRQSALAEERDEVITSPLTAAYTALAISNAGAAPVFADINPETYTLDPRAIEHLITPRTRAIVPVHLYGGMADMKAISEIAAHHNLVVIEDAAQAHGARFNGEQVGARSLAAAYSFYPTKNLGAYGDGGAVTSNDGELIKRIKILRQGGHIAAINGNEQGRNSRLDEIQAACLRVKLSRLEEWNERRRQLASIYTSTLAHAAQIQLPLAPESDTHVYHLYVVQHPQRERLRFFLRERGIETMIHYPYLLHQQTLFRRSSQPALPVAERVAANILSLPLYPQLANDEAHRVANAVLAFYEKS